MELNLNVTCERCNSKDSTKLFDLYDYDKDIIVSTEYLCPKCEERLMEEFAVVPEIEEFLIGIV